MKVPAKGKQRFWRRAVAAVSFVFMAAGGLCVLAFITTLGPTVSKSTAAQCVATYGQDACQPPNEVYYPALVVGGILLTIGFAIFWSRNLIKVPTKWIDAF